jgi:hypothetical protein
MTNDILTQDELKKQLHYDKETGLFTRLTIVKKSHSKIGDIAGSKHRTGYVLIRVNGKRYLAHRLVFLYVNGEFPKDGIDHINTIRSDNSWINLRSASQSKNMMNRAKPSNNSSGYKGVYWHKHRSKWAVQCRVEGKKLSGGYFNDPYLASIAYKELAKKHHGEFYRE